jgi:hypothetical protein
MSTKTRNSQVIPEILEEKIKRNSMSDLNPGFAVNLMHKLKIFYIFSRRSRLLREAPK